MLKIKMILLATMSALLFMTANGLDLESAKEQKCFSIRHTVEVDPVWYNSLTTMFYPKMSRNDLYQIAADLFPNKDPSKIPEAGLYYDSQIVFDLFPNGSFISRGYNGLSREYVSKEIRPGVSDFRPREGTGYQGTIYTTLTDNKTFIVFPFCLENGFMTWCVLSTTPTLCKATEKKIFDHVKSLGFKEQWFTELRYKSVHKRQY